MPDDIDAIIGIAAKRVVRGGEADGLMEQLKIVHPSIERRQDGWLDIDDVMDKALTRRSSTVKSLEGYAVQNIGGGGLDYHYRQVNRIEFRHLPRGALEPWSEYDKRVRITPFFPETPRIVQGRRGAMFSEAPEVEVPEQVLPFLDHIGPRRHPYPYVLDFIATRVYTYGLMAVLVDFRPLPDDVRARISAGEQISIDEAERRGLNQPVLGLFTEREILDFAYSEADGRMQFIKFREVRRRRTGGWATKGAKAEIFRIIDRETISTFEVITDENGRERIDILPPVRHEYVNDGNDPAVPVVLVNPYGTTSVIGDSPVRLSVEADLAASRILSDLVWNLYVHGAPQLVLTTPNAEDNERLVQLGLGANKYIPLKAPNAMTGEEGESLSYLQLDPIGLGAMQDILETFRSRANELASNTTPNATTEPVAMSGVAKAWDYKTGEERALHEHIISITQASDEILKMLTRRLLQRGIITGDPAELIDGIRTSFQPSFDPADPKTNLETVEKLVDLAQKAKTPGMQIAALRRALKSIHGLTDEESEELHRELDGRLVELLKKGGAPEPEPEAPDDNLRRFIEKLGEQDKPALAGVGAAGKRAPVGA